MAIHRRTWRDRVRKCAAVAAAVMSVSVGTAAVGLADEPKDTAPEPFPPSAAITAWYDQLPPEEFFAGTPGVWFNSPLGLTCGIWALGGFGCTGDIPGAPPGDRHIAWFNGNRSVHHGWTAAIQFPPGQAIRTLPPRSYVTYNSTTCATTPSNETYCAHGAFKFLLTAQGAWFKAWDDRRSYVCNFYNSCPPG